MLALHTIEGTEGGHVELWKHRESNTDIRNTNPLAIWKILSGEHCILRTCYYKLDLKSSGKINVLYALMSSRPMSTCSEKLPAIDRRRKQPPGFPLSWSLQFFSTLPMFWPFVMYISINAWIISVLQPGTWHLNVYIMSTTHFLNIFKSFYSIKLTLASFLFHCGRGAGHSKPSSLGATNMCTGVCLSICVCLCGRVGYWVNSNEWVRYHGC